jgi:hypothetical protein
MKLEVTETKEKIEKANSVIKEKEEFLMLLK